MSRRQLPRWSVTLLLAIALWATQGTATQAAAELRALSCCAHDCGHGPARTAAPSRCCGVAPAADDALSASPAAPSAAPALVLVLATAMSADAHPAEAAIATAARGLSGARAAPVFLLTRSLRI